MHVERLLPHPALSQRAGAGRNAHAVQMLAPAAANLPCGQFVHALFASAALPDSRRAPPGAPPWPARRPWRAPPAPREAGTSWSTAT